MAIGREAWTPAFRSNQPRRSTLGRDQIDASAVALRAESNGCAIGREYGLAVISGIAGELQWIATSCRLHPDVEITVIIAVGGVGQQASVRGERRVGVVAGARGELPHIRHASRSIGLISGVLQRRQQDRDE